MVSGKLKGACPDARFAQLESHFQFLLRQSRSLSVLISLTKQYISAAKMQLEVYQVKPHDER